MLFLRKSGPFTSILSPRREEAMAALRVLSLYCCFCARVAPHLNPLPEGERRRWRRCARLIDKSSPCARG